MLLTFLYMVATVTQSRKISFLKKHMLSIFKGNKCSSSIMLYIKSSQNLMNGDYNEPKQDENFMSSHLCLNKDLAKLSELLWYQDDMKLCTVYPQQQIKVWEWVSCPLGNSLFPLNMKNCFKISDEAGHKMHILVEADFETYKPQTSMITTKLEDYGLITSWTTNDNISFILETNVDCITSFIIAVMQGQNYINNNLLLTRIQSVVVSGKPCIYDSKNSLPPEKDILRALSHAAKIASDQNKPIEVAQVSGVIVHPQNKDLNTETSSSFAGTTENNDGKTSSISTSAILPATVVINLNMQSDVNLSSTSTSSEKMPIATTSERDTFDGLAKPELPSAMEKDSTSPDTTDSKVSTEDVSQSSAVGRTVDFQTTITSLKIEGKEKGNKIVNKPPTIVVYADSPDAVNNVIIALQKTLEQNRYVIYGLSREEARSNVWTDQVALAVICGNVDAEIGAQLVEYIIQGGKLLALCSDMLHTLLPSFKTAEVRENELVHFSYGKWKRVRMMHHIFCYHASPVRVRFSQDQEDTRTSALNPPTSTRVKDKRGEFHSFDVKVLGTEETWHNPSILLATLASSGGKVVFSQIHLEVDPTQYEYEEYKFKALKESNTARLEIISDLLNTQLGIETKRIGSITESSVKYTHGYFLGKFEMKVRMLRNLKGLDEDDVLKLPKLVIQFYKDARNAKLPSASFLPIMMHLCPSNFSTVDYYEYLTTRTLGRLVIYADILTSSMHATEGHLEHGLAVISRQQTQGHGRGRNVWLSPIGCAMFTIQVHISTDSILGNRISLLQHIVAVALVSAVRSQSGYDNIDLRLKWPNDIYTNSTKIGGLIVSTQVEQSLHICNIGAGVNLTNSKPTTCINDVIVQYNQKHGTKLDTYSYEKYLALVFNELENILDKCQNDDMESFYELYYKYWLHKNASVTVIKSSGRSENVTILDIDKFGFLRVQADMGATFTVHPDGNSFDLLKGLISSK